MLEDGMLGDSSKPSARKSTTVSELVDKELLKVEEPQTKKRKLDSTAPTKSSSSTATTVVGDTTTDAHSASDSEEAFENDDDKQVMQTQQPKSAKDKKLKRPSSLNKEDKGDYEDEDANLSDLEAAEDGQHDVFARLDEENARSSGIEQIKAAFPESAFAEDDFENEILEKRQSKEEKEAAESEKLKGWGSWTGLGVVEKPKKVTKKLEVKAVDRVQAYQKIDKKFADKYEVKNMPHQYQTKEQYESTLAAPVGRNWNTANVHKYKIQPKVVTRLGAVVAPLQYIKHAKNADERERMLEGWSTSKKPKKPKARF